MSCHFGCLFFFQKFTLTLVELHAAITVVGHSLVFLSSVRGFCYPLACAVASLIFVFRLLPRCLMTNILLYAS